MTPCFLPEIHSQCKLLTLPSQRRWRKRCDRDHSDPDGITRKRKPNLTTEMRRRGEIAADVSTGNYNPIDKIQLKVSQFPHAPSIRPRLVVPVVLQHAA